MEKKIYVEETYFIQAPEPEGPDDFNVDEVRLCQYDQDEFEEFLKTHQGYIEDGFINGYRQGKYWLNGNPVECRIFERMIGA